MAYTSRIRTAASGRQDPSVEFWRMPIFAHFEILAEFQGRAFLAFKLHRSISGAGHVYATVKGAGQRRIALDGQRSIQTNLMRASIQPFFVAGVVKNIIPLFSLTMRVYVAHFPDR
jgi:hypothetical protein